MALQEEAAGAEMLPLRRADLDEVLAVADRRLSHERDRIETTARPPNDPARRAEIIRDAGDHAPQSPDAMLHGELREPQRCGRGDATGPRAAAGQLQIQSVDVLEYQPAVHLRHAIVVAALDA